MKTKHNINKENCLQEDETKYFILQAGMNENTLSKSKTKPS